MTIANNPSSIAPITNPYPTNTHTFEVNTIQSTSSKKLRDKKNNKGRFKKTSSEQGGEETKQPATEGNNNKCKVTYPCMVCKEDHFMRYCPHLAEVHKYLE